MARRLSDTDYTSRRWRLRRLTPDFRIEYVWALEVTGSAEEFDQLVDQLVAVDFVQRSSRLARALVGIRLRVGSVLRWDVPDTERSVLRDRIPAELDLGSNRTAVNSAVPRKLLYATSDEAAAEIVNRTVHGIIHLGWVPEDGGRYRGILTFLVKPRGRLGAVYVKATRPLRALIIYPQLLKAIERTSLERPRPRERGDI